MSTLQIMLIIMIAVIVIIAVITFFVIKRRTAKSREMHHDAIDNMTSFPMEGASGGALRRIRLSVLKILLCNP